MICNCPLALVSLNASACYGMPQGWCKCVCCCADTSFPHISTAEAKSCNNTGTLVELWFHESTDLRLDGFLDLWIYGFTDLAIDGFSDFQTYGSTVWRLGGVADIRVYVFTDLQITDLLIYGIVELGNSGFTDAWIQSFADDRIGGVTDTRIYRHVTLRRYGLTDVRVEIRISWG